MTTETPIARADWLLVDSLAPDPADDALAPLYEGAARGELVLPFCAVCALPLDLEQRVCDGCGAIDTQWRIAEPRGVVHSVTLMHRIEPGLVAATAPYPVLDVDLAAGHRLIMTTVEPAATAPRIGDPVTVGFRSLGDVAVPAARTSSASIERVH